MGQEPTQGRPGAIEFPGRCPTCTAPVKVPYLFYKHHDGSFRFEADFAEYPTHLECRMSYRDLKAERGGHRGVSLPGQ